MLGALPKGDLMLAGFAPNGLFVRRFTLAGEVRWTAALALEAQLGEMAVAPDEGAVLVGKISTAVGPHGFLQGVSSAGAAAWTLGYAPEDPANGVIVSGAAFGPDFFVAAGQEYRSLDQGGTAWIRRIDLEGVMP